MKNLLFTIVTMFALEAMADRNSVKPAGDGTENSPYEISILENFVWLSDNFSKVAPAEGTVYCVQTQDIDAAITREPEWEDGGFPCIRTIYGYSQRYILDYDGQGFTIKNPYIRCGSLDMEIGIFRSGCFQLRNMIVENAEAVCAAMGAVGILVGTICGNSTIENCYVSGIIGLAEYTQTVPAIAGLVGWIDFADQGDNLMTCISQCKADVQITGLASADIGGLIGRVRYESSKGSKLKVSRCAAESKIGFSKPPASGQRLLVGGFIGKIVCDNNCEVVIDDSYSSFSATFPEKQGNWNVAGGFIHGLEYRSASTSSSANELFNDDILSGNNGSKASISRCYSTGSITGDPRSKSGFLNAQNIETLSMTNCYFDITSLEAEDSYATPKTHDEMKCQKTFENWDFEDVWSIEEGVSLPVLTYEVPEPALGVALVVLLCLAVRRK